VHPQKQLLSKDVTEIGIFKKWRFLHTEKQKFGHLMIFCGMNKGRIVLS
jgi:hypothetical protein